MVPLGPQLVFCGSAKRKTTPLAGSRGRQSGRHNAASGIRPLCLGWSSAKAAASCMLRLVPARLHGVAVSTLWRHTGDCNRIGAFSFSEHHEVRGATRATTLRSLGRAGDSPARQHVWVVGGAGGRPAAAAAAAAAAAVTTARSATAARCRWRPEAALGFMLSINY